MNWLGYEEQVSLKFFLKQYIIQLIVMSLDQKKKFGTQSTLGLNIKSYKRCLKALCMCILDLFLLYFISVPLRISFFYALQPFPHNLSLVISLRHCFLNPSHFNVNFFFHTAVLEGSLLLSNEVISIESTHRPRGPGTYARPLHMLCTAVF